MGTHSLTLPGLYGQRGWARGRGGWPSRSQGKSEPEARLLPPSGLAQALPAPAGTLNSVLGVNELIQGLLRTGDPLSPLGGLGYLLWAVEQRAPAGDGRSGEVWDRGNGILPTTSEREGPTQCLEKDGGRAAAGRGRI